jgi:hypothetical protein
MSQQEIFLLKADRQSLTAEQKRAKRRAKRAWRKHRRINRIPADEISSAQ